MIDVMDILMQMVVIVQKMDIVTVQDMVRIIAITADIQEKQSMLIVHMDIMIVINLHGNQKIL